MEFKTTPITQKHLDFIAACNSGEIKRPQWITDWDEKINEARMVLAAAVHQEAVSPEQVDRYMQSIVKMIHRKERLYHIWMEGLPFKTWDALAAECPPTAEDLMRYTVQDTEDYLNGPGVSAFVLFLEERWPGFFKDFVHQCLRECDPLLEEVVELTPEVRHCLSYPEQAFSTSNYEVIETRLATWAQDILPAEAPDYVQRLIVANVMVALENEMGAITQMELARCEAAAPDFATLMRRNNPAADRYLMQTQHWQTAVLLSLWPNS